MAKFKEESGLGAAARADELLRRAMADAMNAPPTSAPSPRASTSERVSIPPADAEAGPVSIPLVATETVTSRSSIPPEDRLKKMAERVKDLRKKSELIIPTVDKTSKMVKRLKQETREAERTLGDTLEKMGRTKEAALLRAEQSPYALSSIRLRASQWFAGETATALEQIEALSKPAEASVDALKKPVNKVDQAKQGIKDSVDLWKKRAKVGGGLLIGTGIIDTIGVAGALSVGKYYAVGIGVEAIFRTYQHRRNNAELKGLLPGAEKTARALNAFIDIPLKAIGDAFLKLGSILSKTEDAAQGQRMDRVVQLAVEANQPQVVEQMRTLVTQRAGVLDALESTPSPDGDIDLPNPLTTTVRMADDVIVAKIARGGDPVSQLISNPGLSHDARVDLPEAPQINPTMNLEEFQVKESFKKIALGGTEAIYEIAPTMKREVADLDTEFPVANPDLDSLSYHLGSIADEAGSLRLLAKSIAEREATKALGEGLSADREEFSRRAGDGVPYKTFDPEGWALERLEGLATAAQTADEIDGSLVGIKNAVGISAVASEPVKTMLRRLVGTIVIAQQQTVG